LQSIESSGNIFQTLPEKREADDDISKDLKFGMIKKAST